MPEQSAEGDYGFIRFSTDNLPEKDRLTVWRETCARTMMHVDMDPPREGVFRCTAEVRTLPNLGIATIATTPNRLTRSRSLVADGNDDFLFVIPLEGRAEIKQRDREAALVASNAFLMKCESPSSTTVQSFSRFMSLAVPAAILSPMMAGIDPELLPVIPDRVEAVRLLTGYLSSLHQDVVLSAPATRHLVVSHVHDLIALAVGATRDMAEVARGRGLRAARLQAAKTHIAAHLGQSDLSVETVAVDQGVTPRYIRKLFEIEGASFSEFVLAQRLTRAHRMLGDPRFSSQSISSIAFAVGFGDISYFNRTFRRHFGATPSEVRAGSARS